MRIDRTWLAAILVAAVGVHAAFFLLYWAGDNAVVLVRWYEQIRTAGFSMPVGNYAPPYLYLLWVLTFLHGLAPTMALIKALSVAGACWLAYAAYRLIGNGLGLLAFALPSVILNASALGQADTFWVAFCILALGSAVRKDHVWVAIWSGLAFGFKAQAVFFAPFVVYLFWIRRVPLHLWAIPLAIYALFAFPAWLAGWPAWDLATIYLRQVDWQPRDYIFVSNSASWWTWFGYLAPEVAFRSFWIGFTTAALGTLLYWGTVSADSPRKLYLAAVLSSAGLPFLLPGMHERFFILADVLAFLYAVAFPTRRAVLAAVLMQIASAFPVIVFAFSLEPWELLAPFFAIGAMLLLVKELSEKSEPTIGEASSRGGVKPSSV